MTYFDAVLCEDETHVILNDTPEKIKKWLEENKDDPTLQNAVVCQGSSLRKTSVENYLNNA
jgi:hypothetical protein